MDTFTGRLRTALTGTVEQPLVYLGNFEVEEQWARGERSLPRVHDPNGAAVVNRMDEFALLLAGGDDHVLLKAAPDPSYLDYLTGLGVDLPTVHVPGSQHPGRNVTEDVLDDPELLVPLSELATQGCHLVAHGVSEVEEALAGKSGLPLAAPDSVTYKSVNSKVYSRRVADDLGLRQPQGWACSTNDELAAAMTEAAALVRSGAKVAVKEAFGVSGKGIAVVDNERRLDRLFRLLSRKTDTRPSFVIEAWVRKSTDLNYQFTVGRDGVVRFDFVKEAVTESGVHKGHRMPARLTGDQTGELRTVAQLLGERLAADGYFGIVGVDAMVDPDGGLYPVTEINARHNMSTYQVPLQERFVGDKLALARHYPLRLAGPLPFEAVRQALSGLLLERAGGTGLVVNNFATVNAAAGPDPFTGRLYGLVIADREDELTALDEAVTARLAALEEK